MKGIYNQYAVGCFDSLRGGCPRKTERGTASRSQLRLQDSIEELGGLRADGGGPFGSRGWGSFVACDRCPQPMWPWGFRCEAGSSMEPSRLNAQPAFDIEA